MLKGLLVSLELSLTDGHVLSPTLIITVFSSRPWDIWLGVGV